MIWHIEPVNDLKEHTDINCRCAPQVKILNNGDLLTVHNSFDGREIAEKFIAEIPGVHTVRKAHRNR